MGKDKNEMRKYQRQGERWREFEQRQPEQPVRVPVESLAKIRGIRNARYSLYMVHPSVSSEEQVRGADFIVSLIPDTMTGQEAAVCLEELARWLSKGEQA